MNNTIFLKLVNSTKKIDKEIKFLSKIKYKKVLKFLQSERGIISSLEYLNYLILNEFKKDFIYFIKEIKYLEEDLELIKKDKDHYSLLYLSSDFYQFEKEEKLINIAVIKYQNIIKLINEIIHISIKGKKVKHFIKKYFNNVSTEELLNLPKQPNNTCPYIDEEINQYPDLSSNLEELRSQCTNARSAFNEIKEEIWENSFLNLNKDKISIQFENNHLDIKMKLFKFPQKHLKSYQNYEKIIEWGSCINKFLNQKQTIHLNTLDLTL